jgi:holo-[acyl-carrier protein] synthase
MICGIGIDSVDIQRFAHWQNYSTTQLRRIFTDAEIAYCTSNKTLMLERLAVRFAAKEAFFKAWSTCAPQCTLSLMSLAPAIGVRHHENGAPYLDIDWKYLYAHSGHISSEAITTHIALTHTGTTATACVILEQEQTNDNNNSPAAQGTDTILDEIELYLDLDEDVSDEEYDDEDDDDCDDDLEIERYNPIYDRLWLNPNQHIMKNISKNNVDIGTKAVKLSNNN